MTLTTEVTMINYFDDILRYENGELDLDEALSFFQYLIDTGLAWRLQGHYGRTAQHLIEDGLCTE